MFKRPRRYQRRACSGNAAKTSAHAIDGKAADVSAESHQRDDGRSISGEASTGKWLAEASVKNHRRDGGQGIIGEPSAGRLQRHQRRAIRGTAAEALAESYLRCLPANGSLRVNGGSSCNSLKIELIVLVHEKDSGQPAAMALR